MDESSWLTPVVGPEDTLCEAVRSRSRLFLLLSWMLSYPDENLVNSVLSEGFPDLIDGLAKRVPAMAALGELPIDGLRTALWPNGAKAEGRLLDGALSVSTIHCPCCCELDYPSRLEHRLRVEHTRLFLTPPLKVPLRGSSWVRESALAKKYGESHAVSACYKRLRLRNRDSVNEPADSLVSELDYMAYVLDAEADSWASDDPLGAREWDEIGEEFLQSHLHLFACRVSRAIRAETKDAYYLFCADILARLATGRQGDCVRCVYE